MLQGDPIVKGRLAKTEKQSELYFTTGEFTRILGVRKHTLFRYNEIGLFSPTLKEENGYRYYSVWQMDMFEIVHALQKLGMSLEEIKEYMEDRSPECFMFMMDGKKRQTDEEMRRLRNMKRFIPHEKGSVQLATKAALDEPRLAGKDREYLPVSDIGAGSERKATMETAEHMRMQEKYHDTVGAVGPIYLGEGMNRSVYGRYVRVYARLDKETTSRRVQDRSGGAYVEPYNRGHLWDMEKPYRLISALAGEREVRLGQMWYRDLTLDELMVKEYEQYTVRAMAPVESEVISP